MFRYPILIRYASDFLVLAVFVRPCLLCLPKFVFELLFYLYYNVFTATIVFQATLSSLTSYTDNQEVMFPSVTYNEGSGYSNTTGKFTAPVSGVYAFAKQTCTDGNYAYTAFVHNTQIVLASEARTTSASSCSSAQIFVHMSKGDLMWIKTTSNSYLYHDGPYRQTSFSGALMHT